MSYILDALRKSEDERTQDKVRRESLRGPSYHSERSISLLPWMLLLLLFSLALTVWWFWPTLQNIVAQARDSTNAKSALNDGVAALTASQSDANTEQLRSGVSSSFGGQSKTNSGANSSTTNSSTANSSAINSSTTGRADNEFYEADDVLPPGNQLKELWQLPVDFQARIPEMIFSFHVYSDKPSSRTIIINGRRLKEGAMVTSRIKLRMISATGVILHAHGRFFHVDVYEQMYVPTSN